MTGSVSRAEMTRRAYELYESGNLGELQTLYHPEVFMRTEGLRMPGGNVSGRRALLASLARTVEQGMNVGVTCTEAVEHGDIVLATVQRAEERASPAASLMYFEDGVIRAIHVFRDPGEALDRLEAIERAEAARPEWPQFVDAPHRVGFVEEHLPEREALAVSLVRGDELEVPAPEGTGRRAPAGAAILVFAGPEEEVLGWYMPDERVGVDLRGSG